MVGLRLLAAGVCAGLLLGSANAQVAQQSVQEQAAEAAPDLQAQAETKLLLAARNVVTALEASGRRTPDGIENSDVTLTLGEMDDASRLSVLCSSGGADLSRLTQELVGFLNLPGKVRDVSCTGNGKGAEAFKLKFQLHHEAGQNGLFTEDPLLLPVMLSAVPTDAAAVDQDTPVDDEAGPSSNSTEPVLLNAPPKQTSHSTISLPKGWTPDDMPAPLHEDSPYVTYDLSYTYADGTLTADQTLILKKTRVEPVERAAFEQWSEKSKMSQGAPSVSLNSTLYFPNSAFDGKTEDEKKAAQLLSTAWNEIDNHQLDDAEKLIDQADALDHDRELLHDRRCRLAAARGQFELALKECREELRLYPNALLENEMIANVEERMGRKDDAIATLQAWMAADPDSPFPPTQLMWLYSGMGRDDLASAVGGQAWLTLPEDARNTSDFLIVYAREQRLTGQNDAASVAFERLLDRTEDIEYVNDAAYYLAENDRSLDRAEQAVRESLKQFDADERFGSSHMHPMSNEQQASLMFAAWDTLGYILVREGETKEAESYVRAAWHWHPDPAIGRHLAELLITQKKPVEALDTYTLALAVIPEKNRASAEKDPDVIAIHEGIARLEKQGYKTTVQDPKAALEQMRIVDAGTAAQPHKDETYLVTIGADGMFGFPKAGTRSGTPPLDLSNVKLPAGILPDGSKAQISREAKLNCATSCTLTFAR